MRKRKSPIAKSLIKNSISGILSAIEIHNKPTIKYRYEIVVLLILNTWELLLKGYLYKFHKEIKIFQKDGTTKSFKNCLNIVNTKIGKDFNPVKENLKVLYGYRNHIAHFYIKELDTIIYSLIRKNVIFYSRFLLQYFKVDISETSDLILLPIGFKKPISPLDYISNSSISNSASEEVKAFIKSIVDASKRLNRNNIDETIFVDFKMNLTSINRTKNADIIAGIDNTKENELVFKVSKRPKTIISSNVGEKIILTRDKSESQGILYYESLQDGIFDEINNIVDANHLLSKGTSQFMLGLPLYYRIYAERQYVNYNIDKFELFAKTGMMEFYAPFLYWLLKLPEDKIAKLLFENYHQCKSPNINNLIKILILLGSEAIDIFYKLFEKKYKIVVQKPNFYYNFHNLIKRKKTNLILKALKTTRNSKVDLINKDKNYTIEDFLDDNNLSINQLSTVCLDLYIGEKKLRSVARDLDFLAYGNVLIGKKDKIINELKKIVSRSSL